jgi:hypothetical protein
MIYRVTGHLAMELREKPSGTNVHNVMNVFLKLERQSRRIIYQRQTMIICMRITISITP